MRVVFKKEHRELPGFLLSLIFYSLEQTPLSTLHFSQMAEITGPTMFLLLKAGRRATIYLTHSTDQVY